MGLKLFILGVFFAGAVSAECDHLYPNQKPIYIKNTKEICNSWYVVRYDEKARAPVLVSEVLNGKESGFVRSPKFVTDHRVKFPVTPNEYERSGWDRGHLVPSGDSSNEKEMLETFLMTNIVPQAPKLNRGPWAALEKKIRNRVKDSVYVITGAVYDGSMMINGNVPIPRQMFKIVYYLEQPEYWIADNIDGGKFAQSSKAEIESLIGAKLP